jgi:hypothetical protein
MLSSFGVSWLFRGGAMLNFAITEFYEDEMRRPTPYAVPLGLQTFDGL